MSIYYKEKPENLNRAFISIWDDQLVKPSEIVLVLDGVLTRELDSEIEGWKEKLGSILKIVPLPENVGLGDALNRGLQECSFDLVARMDTDDISLPNRFQEQLKEFENKNIDICSSDIDEFESDEYKITSSRKLPSTHNELIKYSKKRNPLNHPSVMFKKQSVLNAGGYEKMYLFEDYYLWVRMFISGSKFSNIPLVLLKMRGGESQIKRRHGFNYALKEIHFQKRILELKYITHTEFVINVIIRFFSRIIPRSLLSIVYSFIRKK